MQLRLLGSTIDLRCLSVALSPETRPIGSPQSPLSQQLTGASTFAMMRGDTLVQQHPPTPPNAGSEYQSGLHPVAQYGVDRGYSFSETGYGSPGSVAHEGIPSHASHADNHPRGLGLGIQYVRVPASSHM